MDPETLKGIVAGIKANEDLEEIERQTQEALKEKQIEKKTEGQKDL